MENSDFFLPAIGISRNCVKMCKIIFLCFAGWVILKKYVSLRTLIDGMEDIKHAGIVESVSGDTIRVRIVQESACASCHASGHCMAAEAREKYIDCRAEEPLAEGDRVTVEVSEKMGWIAVLLSFVLPLVLLVCILWIAELWLEETWAGTIALCSLLPYYGMLALLKKKIKKRFDFVARKRDV